MKIVSMIALLAVAVTGQLLSKAPTPGGILVPTPIPVLSSDDCFMMEQENGADFVEHGKQIAGVVPKATKPYAILIMFLSEVCVDSTQHVEVVSSKSQPPGLGLHHKVEGDVGKKSNMTHQGGILTLDFICPLSAKTERDFNVSVTLKAKGGKEYQPLYFQIAKLCMPNVVPAAPGMSGFGKFVLVISLLALLGCTLGCGVNYVSRGKTGMEIVPFGSSISHCLGRFVREPRYTPQMDYESPAGEEYGATYQTDL